MILLQIFNVVSLTSCGKEITKDVFFDRKYSHFDKEDDLENELIEDGGIIRTASKSLDEFVVKGIDSTKWYSETTFTIHSFEEYEHYPKIGIFTITIDNFDYENKIYFYLDADIGYK